MHFLRDAVDRGASDIFLIAGRPVTYKIMGSLVAQDENRLEPQHTNALVQSLYQIAERDMGHAAEGDDDFSVAVPRLSRFRVNIYRQRGSLAAVIRVITFDLPDPAAIGIPEAVMQLSDANKGLILVTGAAGSGKSTTLACMIDRINRSRSGHIITLEDPLEYLHRHQKSIVSQREISTDTESYVQALRAALRQSPDVVLLGEMRDHDTIGVAMTAAETGHLVLSTLHTVGAANTIDRVVDAFPPNQQNQIRVQLSMVLLAVVSQQLVPTEDGRVAPAFEIMVANGAIRNMIREGKIHQIDSVIYSAGAEGMLSMDASLFSLYEQGVISSRSAMSYSVSPDMMAKRIAR